MKVHVVTFSGALLQGCSKDEAGIITDAEGNQVQQDKVYFESNCLGYCQSAQRNRRNHISATKQD